VFGVGVGPRRPAGLSIRWVAAPGPLRVKSTAGEVPLVWSFSVGLFPNGA
jgi:hypothetical protein